jgi:hypothetical protein
MRVLLHEAKPALIPILFSGFWAGALYSIYYRHRLLVAICLIAIGVVGTALASDFLTTPLPRRADDLSDKIRVETMIVTKAELRRHWSAGEKDRFRPSTRAELAAAYSDLKQPVYLVARFLPDMPGHYTGRYEVRCDGQLRASIPVGLHFTQGWVEYFIPLSGLVYAIELTGPNMGRVKEGRPAVSGKWVGLSQE